MLALAVALAVHTAAASTPRFVDYVYIEANEGGSSGGHSAIRFADETYHFQHEHPGLLRLRRDDWQGFRYAYGVLENRTMHVSRVAVADATYARLRQQFNERHLSERRIFEHRDELRDERLLLELLSGRLRGASSGAIGIRGAGFFFPADEGSPPSVAVRALREHVLRTYGEDAIARRIAEVRAEIARLSPSGFAPPTAELPADGYPDFPYTFSRRYRDLLTAEIALLALDRTLSLRPGSYWAPDAPDLALDPSERDRLATYADGLVEQLTRLLHSDRPDWGFAFLVGMARLEAMWASGETGRLVLLDAFPSGPDAVPRSYMRRHRDAVAGLRAEASDEFARARARFRAGRDGDEAGFAEMEAAGNRLLELDAASAENRDLRVSGGSLVPSREAAWSELIVPDVTADALARRLAQTEAAENRFATRLRERYGYDLFTRNCASEIFRTVDAAGVEPGGRVATGWSLAFVPFLAARAVNATWNVVGRTTFPSYRRWRLGEMSLRESALRVRLRESNVLTSTIYHANGTDSFFLFFTDDVSALRPLLGAVNLASGLGAAAVGLPLLPFDRGGTLMAGVRGVVFSLPELVFVNLRKGSFVHVPRAERPSDAGGSPS